MSSVSVGDGCIQNEVEQSSCYFQKTIEGLGLAYFIFLQESPLKTIPFQIQKMTKIYPDFCRQIFHLFAQGLTHKQIEDQIPQAKETKFYREHLQPSYQLVFEHIEKQIKANMPFMNSEEFENIKDHFFRIISSRIKDLYKGINYNIYGETLTKNFIKICKHFERQGNLETIDSKILLETTKGLYTRFKKEFPQVEKKERMLKKETKNVASRATKRVIKKPQPIAQHIEKQIVQQKQQTKSKMVSEIAESHLLALQLKEKEIEALKIEREIMLKKESMLKLQNERLKLQQMQQQQRNKRENKSSISAWQAKQKNEEDFDQEEQTSEKNSGQMKTKKIIKKTTKGKQTRSKQPAKVVKQSETEQEDVSQHDASPEESQYMLEEPAQESRTTRPARNRKLPIPPSPIHKSTNQHNQPTKKSNASFIQKQDLQPKNAKKSSKKPEPKPKDSDNKTKLQKTAPVADEEEIRKDDYISLNKPPLKLTLSEMVKAEPKKVEKVSVKQEAAVDSCQNEWSKEQEVYLIEYLNKSKMQAQKQISSVMVRCFGSKKYFKGQSILQKRREMFKRCSEKFLAAVKLRKLFDIQFDQLADRLNNVNWRSAHYFVNSFLKKYYFAQFKKIPNEIIMQSIDQILELKSHHNNLKVQTNKDGNDSAQIETQDRESQYQTLNNQDLQQKIMLSFKKNQEIYKRDIPKEVISMARKNMCIRTGGDQSKLKNDQADSSNINMGKFQGDKVQEKKESGNSEGQFGMLQSKRKGSLAKTQINLIQEQKGRLDGLEYTFEQVQTKEIVNN